MKLIDTHNHLYLEDFDPEQDQLVTAAKESGIDALLLPNVDTATIGRMGYAIRSKWNMEAKKKRQIIVVWTDASNHELGYGRSQRDYPQKMAKDFSELTSWWGNSQMEGYIDQSAKRLILFAPEASYWSEVADNWENVIHCPSQAGKGVAELDYHQIIDTISNTI